MSCYTSLGAVLMLFVPVSTTAQTSYSGLPVSGWTAEMAFAGGGAAAWDDVSRSVVFAALATKGPQSLVVGATTLESSNNNLRSLKLGVAHRLGPHWAVNVGGTWRQMVNLVDDPSFPDAGLRIVDREFSLGIGRSVPAIRTSFGVGIQRNESEVFATRASATGFGLSVLAEPTNRIRMLLGVSGIGSAVRYDTGQGEARGAPQKVLTICSIGLRITDGAQLSSRLYFDYRSVTKESRRFSLAGEIVVLHALTARAGLGLTGDNPRHWEAAAGWGFTVRIESLTLEYAYFGHANPNDLTPRQSVGLAWSHRMPA